jgi:hypothetical protein
MAILSERARRSLFWLLTATLVAIPVAAQPVTEQDVKAVFLYKFTNFVEWPAAVWQGSAPFRFCVAASKEMTAVIEQTVAGETVNGRAVETRVVTAADDARQCHILFIGRSETARAPALLAAVRALPVLTVGESEDFVTSSGGAIGFVVVGGRVRFDINVENAKRGGLTMSSRLLQVARKLEGASR